MSWWTSVNVKTGDGDEDYECIEVPNHSEGGTYTLDGVTEADLNVTYNYGGHFETALGMSLWALDKMSVDNAIPILEKGVERLGTERDPDYWKPTTGNAGTTLKIILYWCYLAKGKGLDAFLRVL